MQPVTPAGVLIGRTREMALLTGLMAEAARGRGRAVLVEGEPGIGKSALVRAAVARAPEAGCEVAWCAADELSRALPLLPFLDGLRVREPSANPRRTAMVRLLRGESATERTDVPAILAEQLLALVAEQCAARPVILVLDDLHWADRASVTLWGRLARSAPQLPLLLVGTLRPVPQRDDLQALRRTAGDAVRLELAGLTGAAVAGLVAALAGGTPGGDLLRLAGGAAGNPLYLTELVAALTRSGSLTVTGAGTAELAGGAAPESLPAAIADRLGFVAGPVREALRAATLLGAEFSVSELAVILGRGVADLIPAIDEARAAGVLAESGGGLGFRHPLIRAALYDEMPAPVRAAWHRDAARALAAAGVPADRVARQVLRAAGGPDGLAGLTDGWMLDWLTRAADPLAVQAPGVAVELLARAAAGSPAGSAHRGVLASRLAAALYRVGDTAKAEELASRELESAADLDLRVDLHWTLAQCRLRAGAAQASLATLDQALAYPGLSARQRARLLVLAARTHESVGEVGKGGQVAAGALEAASAAGDTWAMGWALHVLTLATASQGHIPDALPLWDRALAVTESDPALTDLRLILQVNKAVALGKLDRYEEALAEARAARDLAGQIGMVHRLGQAHSALSQLLFDTGSWDEALAELQAVQHDLKEPGAACSDLGTAAVIRFHRSELGAARRCLAASVPHARQLGDHRLVASLERARSMNHEYDGDVPKALAVLADAVNSNAEELDEIEDLLVDAVRLAVQAGELRTAQALERRAAAHAAGTHIPHREADVLYCRGLVDRDASRLLAAAERYDDAGRSLQKAKALEAAAEEFIGAGDHDQARVAFTRAGDVYGSLGAAADVARLHAAFRARGIRRGPHARHRRARSGWDSLTPAEVNVAALVETGLSNPQIAAKLQLSPRTIATHVSHILKKLNLRSRAEIAVQSALHSAAPR